MWDLGLSFSVLPASWQPGLGASSWSPLRVFSPAQSLTVSKENQEFLTSALWTPGCNLSFLPSHL